MAAQVEQAGSPRDDSQEVFRPILLRSSTPPPSEKVSLFLKGMAEAPRVSKPLSNFGSEFDHMSGIVPWESENHLDFMGGPPVNIPADAQATHELNDELFNQGPDDSPLSYAAALGPHAYHEPEIRQPDEIQSVDQDKSTVHGADPPALPPKSIIASPQKEFRNGKIIDSSSSWGNKGPIPNIWKPIGLALGDTPAVAAAVPLPAPGQTPATPFISIQPPTDPARSASRTPSPQVQSESAKSRKSKSHMSEVINANDVQQDGGQGNNANDDDDDNTTTQGEKKDPTVKSPSVHVQEDRTPSRAPSRQQSRAPSRADGRSHSRAPSRAERALSPVGKPERSPRPTSNVHGLPTPTPSKVPLPSSPGGGSVYIPLHIGSPPRQPSRAPTKASSVASAVRPPSRAKSPISGDVASPPKRAPSLHPLSKKGESVVSPTSPQSPTRLHPLTDILRHESTQSPPNVARSRTAQSVRSHRSTAAHDLPPITVQLSQTSDGGHDIKPVNRMTSNGGDGSRAPSRAKSPLRQQSQPEEDEDDRGDNGQEEQDQVTPLVKGKEITEIDLTRTPRTSYTAFTATPSVLAGEVNSSHFHDEELCILLHAADNEYTHDVVKKVLRKGVRDRVRKLGLDHQKELILARKHHQQGVHRQRAIKAVKESPVDETPPKWAESLFALLREQQIHIERLEDATRVYSRHSDHNHDEDERIFQGPEQDQAPTVDNGEEGDEYGDEYPQTPHMTVPIDTPRGEAEEFYDEEDLDEEGRTDGDETRSKVGTLTQREYDAEGDEPSEYNPHVEKAELYRLRIKEQSHEKGMEKTWHVAETGRTQPETLPEIPGSDDHGGYMEDRHAHAMHEDIHHNEVDNDGPSSPPLPPLPLEATSNALRSYPQGAQWASADWQAQQSQQFPSWQRVYQRLLNWALVWSEAELQRALTSTLPGVHVDEVALTIWLTQTYKRYVRAKHVEHPPGRVDRLYIPPNIADAINVAVFNGRHGDAKVMLRDLWAPFGFDGMPRLLIVLARHRRDANHYVVHRFALPEGSLTTYDTYPEKALADGRPLGWWFAIQAAWPNAMYPQPDNLVQKIIRINRPMQLTIDNSVAAAAIWRNLIMGSKAERTVDLVRLRDLINTEVKSLIARKDLGRLSVMGGKTQWEDIPP